MKKVLFITYYWPPAGGAPVNRILKFYKYLPEFGWEPVILTTEDGDFPFEDKSLFDEVRPDTKIYRSKVFSLHKIFSKISPKSKKNFIPYGFTDTTKSSFMDKLSRWVKYNFIPDTRFPWYFSTVSKAIKIIKEEHIDIIFSSSPPQTNHLIARTAARKTGIPWVADFRDPWTDVFWLLNNSIRWKWIHKIDQRIEHKTIARMDAIITVGPSLVEILKRKTKKPIQQIPNGYDHAYFMNFSYKPNKKFRITYAGSLSKEQNPECFFRTLDLLKKRHDFFEDFELLFLGNFPLYLKEIAEKYSYSNKIIYQPYTFYTDSLKIIAQSELLLLIIPDTDDNKCIITSKLFDYMGSERPILAYGPEDGDASEILKTSGAGQIFDYKNIIGASEFILKVYHNWKNNEPYPLVNSQNIEQYTRRNLTKHLADIFNSLSVRK